MHNLSTENNLVESSSEFEAAMQSAERSSLKLLCDKMSLESELEDDKETWGFLKVMFEDDGTARTKLLTHLGFSLPTEAKDAVQDNLSQDVNALGIEERAHRGQTGIKETISYPFDGEDFFNNLPSPKADTPVSTSGSTFDGQSSIPNGEEIQQQSDEQEETADALFDDTVQRALVVGDYTGAVAQCLNANRIADALVIAHVGGASLWESTRDQYLKMSHSPYLKVVSALVNNDLRSLVNTRPLKAWKETLALLCTFAQREEWTVLCDALASRLVEAGRTLEATLCYICAGNIDKTVEIWSKSVTTKQNRNSYVGLLQGIMEKTMILAMATGQKRSASLCKLVEKYAEILASQGLLTTAMKYLNFMGNEELTPELVILRDCIALSTEPEREAPASADFGSSQSQNAYVADRSNYGVETPQNYYQEMALPQLQKTIQSSQESLNPSYARAYVPPGPYRNSTQSGIFLPTPGPVLSAQSTCPTPAFSNQPAVRPFVPNTPPALRNVEQYQQSTLGSQLYPGPSANPSYQAGIQNANPSYQAGIQNANSSYQAGIQVAGSRGPVPSQFPGSVHMMPQVVTPTSGPRGFTPISNTEVQRSGMGLVQPPSHTQTPPAPAPVAPPAPPPTVQTVDTSNVPAQQRPVITTLTKLFNETSEALGGSRANPAKKREIEDNSKKFGSLFEKLNSGDISKNAGEKLVQLCQALDRGDFSSALQIQVLLTTSDWDECNTWLAALKRMIKTRQNVR